MQINIQEPSTISSQNHVEIVSLIIQYMNNELPESCAKKVENLIHGCKECQSLYNEVKSFFNPDDKFIFELFNEEKIENARRELHAFSEQLAKKGGESKVNEKPKLEEWDSYSCCGA